VRPIDTTVSVFEGASDGVTFGRYDHIHYISVVDMTISTTTVSVSRVPPMAWEGGAGNGCDCVKGSGIEYRL